MSITIGIEVDLNPAEGALPGVALNLPREPESVTATFDLEKKTARVYIKFRSGDSDPLFQLTNLREIVDEAHH